MKLNNKHKEGADAAASDKDGGGSGILKVVSWSRKRLSPEDECGGVKAFDVVFGDGRKGCLNIDAFAFATAAGPEEWCNAEVGGERVGLDRLLLPLALRKEIEPVLVGPAYRLLLAQMPYSDLERLIAGVRDLLVVAGGDGETVSEIVTEASKHALEADALLKGLPHGPFTGLRQLLNEDSGAILYSLQRLRKTLKALRAMPGLSDDLRSCALYADEVGVYAYRVAVIRETLAEAARGLGRKCRRSR